ncbi:MAG: hypothetical protein ACUVWP_05150 [bacterium]
MIFRKLNNFKKIGLETSSIMPLLEITPRTLPLQKHIIKIIDNTIDVEFCTDLHSVEEATQQINTSFDVAIKSIEKAKEVVKRLKSNDILKLSIIFIKSLSENFIGGRMETLRWSDVIDNDVFYSIKNSEDFFKVLKKQMENKKQKYLSMLEIKKQYLEINCKDI